ncbi:MAG: YsnF/AvaK domain-containing protein [Crinalium sp.]
MTNSEHDANRDPISGEPGSHPVGTGIGAAGAGAMGAAIGGVVGGPIGAVVGSVIGSVAGGLVGKGAAEAVNPTEEDTYWQDNYTSRPYVEPDTSYDTYQPAYTTGYEGFSRYADTDKTYDEVEPELQSDYEKKYASSGVPWEKAKHAARDAYLKLYEERLVADKQRVKAGEVTVGKHVETETARVSVPVEKERVIVERITPTDAGTAVNPATVNFGQGETAHIDVYEETADVQKQAFVREEVKIRKEVEQEVVQVNDQVRREELDIDTQGQSVIDRNNKSI